MKITKKQLKALIREQVAAVINETDWRDVSDPDYHKSHKKDGPYADEDDVEWMEDRFHDDQDDWPEEESEEEAFKLPNPMKQRDPKYGNKLSARQWINRQRDKLKEGQEEEHIISLLQRVLDARGSGDYEFEQEMLGMDPSDRQKLIRTLEYLRDGLIDDEEEMASVVAETLSRIKHITEEKDGKKMAKGRENK